MGHWFAFDFASCQKSSDFDDKKCHSHSYSGSKQRFGVCVHWDNDRHYDAIQLEPYRLIGDVEMDRILEMCLKIGDDRDRFYNVVQSCEKIYLEKRNSKRSMCLSDCERAMYEFYLHYHEIIPEWVNWDQIQKGIDIFVTFSPIASQTLFYLSLVPVSEYECIFLRMIHFQCAHSLTSPLYQTHLSIFNRVFQFQRLPVCCIAHGIYLRPLIKSKYKQDYSIQEDFYYLV